MEKLTAAEAAVELPALTVLLLDAVDSGASVGFLPPLETGDAREYWNEVIHAMDSGNRILIAAFLDGDLVGSVQLESRGQAECFASRRGDEALCSPESPAAENCENAYECSGSSCERCGPEPSHS